MSNETVRVTEKGVPGEKRIHKADFDPSVHALLKKGTKAEDVNQQEARTARAKELKDMSADDVKGIAVGNGIERTTKAANIEAILDTEFSEE